MHAFHQLSAAAAELQHIQAAAEQQRISEVERITHELKELHSAEIGSLKASLIARANSSLSEKLKKQEQAHKEELERVCSGTEASASKALEARTELQPSAAELRRVQAAAEQQGISELEHITPELKEAHLVEMESLKASLNSAANSLQSEEFGKLEQAHKDQLECVRSDMEASASKTLEARTDLLLSAAAELEQVHAEAEQQRILEVERITHELLELHTSEMESLKIKFNCHSKRVTIRKTKDSKNRSTRQS